MPRKMHKTQQQQQQHELSSEIRSAIEKKQTPCENEKSRVSKTQQSTTIAPRACSFVASIQKEKKGKRQHQPSTIIIKCMKRVRSATKHAPRRTFVKDFPSH
jgi:hypothetical protein